MESLDGAGLCSKGNKRPAFREVKVFTKLGEAFLRLTSEADMRRDLYKDDLVHGQGQTAVGRVSGKGVRSWLGEID